MKTHLLTLLLLLVQILPAFAQTDSARVETLLQKGLTQATTPLHLWYARQLIGTPYVGQTLEVNPTEQLVVNLRQLDCTTFVETAIALAMTHKQGSTRYADYCRNLTRIRYRNGVLDGYPSRNHYFTQWIESNERLGLVKERTLPTPISQRQTISINYMSQHPDLYPMLRDDKPAQERIRRFEQETSGKQVRFIPRANLNKGKQTSLGLIKDGDILAIVTRKQGLDTSHIGFAVWGKDGKLHLLNASQIHKKVVSEPMTLFEYMGKHPSQLGIRVIEVIP
ncbi:MAG: DUF1460 domain-containing protein [Bacteroidaceae bacterium]|nr:DUF1460 domain-containing protein [Bacteroidaceae bacterium]